MNKRLNELMLKAGYAAPHLAGRAHTLAALIINECIEIVEPCKCGCNDGLAQNDTTLSNTVKMIKDHFGITE